MTPDNLIDFYHSAYPRRIFEMDECALGVIRSMKDPNGVYIWHPSPNYPDMPGTLFGLPITISKEPCFQMLFLFEDGHRHVVKYKYPVK